MEWCNPPTEVEGSTLLFWNNGLLELQYHKRRPIRYFLWAWNQDRQAIEIRFPFPLAKNALADYWGSARIRLQGR